MKKHLYFAGSAIAVLSACSLIYSQNNEQCQTTADCLGKGPTFGGTVCGPLNTCDPEYCYTNDDCAKKIPAVPGAVCGDNHQCAVDATKSCNTNAECMDAFATAPAGFDGGAPGQPHFCRQSDHQCIQLTSATCSRILH